MRDTPEAPGPEASGSKGPERSEGPDSEPQVDPRVVATIVACALFMQNLDSSAVATALPAMARDLGEDPVRLGVAITSYLVALTVFIPFSGWVADRFGAKRVFMAAIVVFTLASMLCGQASSLLELVLWRSVQGMGGAMMVPVGRLLILRRVKPEEMISAMTWLTMPAMIGPISGPPLGGFLTDAFGWRSVFYVNLPIGILGLVMVAWKIPRVPPTDPGPPDILGLVLVGLTLALGMFGLETVGRGVVPGPWPVLGIAAAAVLGLLAWRHCRRVERPALDLSLLRIPSFRDPTLPGSLFRMGTGALPFLIPLLLQVGFGASATASGLVSFASALGAFAMKPLARPLLRRLGFRRVLVGNAVLAAASVAVCALFTPAWPTAAIFAVLAVGGLFRSLQFAAMNTLVFAEVPKPRLSAATAFYGTAQQLPQPLGVVLGSAAVEGAAALAGRAHHPEAVDFSAGFLVAALVMLAPAPFHARLPADAGATVSGHRARAPD